VIPPNNHSEDVKIYKQTNKRIFIVLCVIIASVIIDFVSMIIFRDPLTLVPVYFIKIILVLILYVNSPKNSFLRQALLMGFIIAILITVVCAMSLILSCDLKNIT